MAEYELCFSLWEKGKQAPKAEGNLADFLSDPLKWATEELQKELQKDFVNIETAKFFNEIIIFINANKNLLMPKEYTVKILAREKQDR